MDPYLVGSGLAVCGGILWLIRRYCDGGWCYSKARLDGKTVVITGANTGIGKETARDLARRGARIILACRDIVKAEKAATEICKDTGSNNLVVRKLDLASLASIREFVKNTKEEETRLDILINNAGIMMCPQWKTEDGFEMQFGVNHLGHFLLTNLLLDLMKSSSPARIVNVSSLGHIATKKIPWDDINMSKNYHPIAAYGLSKLANILFTKELGKRLQGTGVTVYALHPGSIKTELTRHINDALGFLWRWMFWLAMIPPISTLVLKTPLQGAQTSIYCAVDEELKDVTGCYFSDCALQVTSKLGQDDESARRLWELSAKMVNLEKKVE